jgi:large subunit ribosomal protein L1
MYNEPNAQLIAHVEINMKGEKGTRMVENFHRTAAIKHKFEHGEERTVLVLAKGQEFTEIARNAGASHMGGTELIKDIQNGDLLLTDYQYIIAHPNILPDLVPVRGLMKKKFPNPKLGTLGTNIEEMVQRFINGIQYSAMKNEHQPDFGLVTVPVGTLNMDEKHLEENLVALIKDIDMMRPKRAGKFISRVLLKSPPSPEKLKIDPFLYVEEGKKEEVKKKTTKAAKEKVQEEEEDEEEQVAKEAAN